MDKKSTLIFFCGKMGAGKSTKSKQIAKEKNAVLLSEDELLSSLYPNLINTFNDYLHFSAQIRPLIRALTINILQTGTNVVMDFPANTINQRKWFVNLASEATSNHKLIYLNVNDETCLNQIAQRSIEQPERARFDTESVFHEVTKYFEEPMNNESLNIEVIKQNSLYRKSRDD